MTLKERLLRVTHLLFVILLLVQLLPDRSAKDVYTGALIAFAVGLEAVTVALSFLIKKKESLTLLLDIVGFIFVLLTLWSLATAKFNVLNDLLFPAPGKVLHQFAEDREKIIINIKSSLGITVKGFLLAADAHHNAEIDGRDENRCSASGDERQGLSCDRTEAYGNEHGDERLACDHKRQTHRH